MKKVLKESAENIYVYEQQLEEFKAKSLEDETKYKLDIQNHDENVKEAYKVYQIEHDER